MHRMSPPPGCVTMVALWCLIMGGHPAASQTVPTLPPNADDGSPWGGVPVTSTRPGPPPPSGSTSFCVTASNPDPCVLTGQYNRYRSSTNAKESSLANFSNANFGLAYLYQINHPATGGSFNWEPVIAQPLYVTNVSYGGTTHDMLIVASLNDYVYAFDTGATSTSNVLTPLWSLNLIGGTNVSTHCQSGGQAFYNIHNGLPGAANLPYYGIVATPVIDNTATTNPTAFVASACTASGAGVTTIQWFLDAVDLTTGTSVATQAITDTNFNPSNQLSRASLLLSHPSGAGTSPYIYIAFGAGVKEIGAESGTNQWQYSGALFGYSYSYSSNTFTAITSSPFYTECVAASGCPSTGVFPHPVYTNFDGAGYPAGPAGPGTATGDCMIPPTGTSNCSPGSNWGVNGGGLWQSSSGPSSTSAANVYIASGNGAFACTGSGPSCTISSPVDYWGETSMQFPAGNSTTLSPMSPQDFFTPNTLRYTCPYGTTCSANMPNGTGGFVTDPLVTTSYTTYQSEELSRLDLDLGVGGNVILPHSVPGVSTLPFSMTSDKSSYLYVMPPAVGETGLTTGGLGQFQANDAGLNGSGLTYTTQTPFQINREPASGYPVCETVTSHGRVTGSCDEVHELAWFSTFKPADSSFHDLLVVWPAGESVEDFAGAMSSPYASFSFGTSPQFDPCPLPFTSTNCAVGVSNPDPPFPLSSSESAGAPMAVALNISNTSPSSNAATLWAVVPQTYPLGTAQGTVGALYGYKIVADPTNSSFGSLGAAPIWHWNPQLDTGTQCANVPSGITAWFPPAFTEPTLADNQQNGTSSAGAVYVPTACVINDGNQSIYKSCANAQFDHGATLLSGVLTFATCH